MNEAENSQRSVNPYISIDFDASSTASINSVDSFGKSTGDHQEYSSRNTNHVCLYTYNLPQQNVLIQFISHYIWSNLIEICLPKKCSALILISLRLGFRS